MKINGYLSENLNNFTGSLVVEDFGTKAFTAERVVHSGFFYINPGVYELLVNNKKIQKNIF